MCDLFFKSLGGTVFTINLYNQILMTSSAEMIKGL